MYFLITSFCDSRAVIRVRQIICHLLFQILRTLIDYKIFSWPHDVVVVPLIDKLHGMSRKDFKRSRIQAAIFFVVDVDADARGSIDACAFCWRELPVYDAFHERGILERERPFFPDVWEFKIQAKDFHRPMFAFRALGECIEVGNSIFVNPSDEYDVVYFLCGRSHVLICIIVSYRTVFCTDALIF